MKDLHHEEIIPTCAFTKICDLKEMTYYYNINNEVNSLNIHETEVR